MSVPAAEARPARVSAVVLSYRNFSDTDECLRSLEAQDYPHLQTILVDNGSGDGSLERLREAWHGRVTFVETGANLGVAGGYNAGIRAALDDGADYVLLCNNDIALDPAFVTSLLEVHAQRPRTAAAVSVMTYYDRPGRIWFGWVSQQPQLHLSRNRLRGSDLGKLGERAGRVFPSDYVPTCATLLSRPALEAVGLLDERYFFGHDDVDWCIRARRLGFECNVLGRPLVRHKVSVTSGIRGTEVLSPFTAFTQAQGSVLIGVKHFRGLRAPAFFFGLLCVRVPYAVAAMALAGQWRSAFAYLRGIGSGLARYGPGLFRRQP